MNGISHISVSYKLGARRAKGVVLVILSVCACPDPKNQSLLLPPALVSLLSNPLSFLFTSMVLFSCSGSPIGNKMTAEAPAFIAVSLHKYQGGTNASSWPFKQKLWS